MTKKKILLSAVALILVCALTAVGTMALLKKTADPVTNTFVAGAADDDDFVESLTLLEKAVSTNSYGENVESATSWVKANTYNNVLPGTALPKTIKVAATGKNDAPGYLYVEIVNTLDSSAFSWSVDTNKWKDLGINGRNVYVYTTNGTDPAIITADVTVEGVLTNNKITVNDVALNLSNTTNTMVVKAYMAQATVAVDGVNTSDAKTVFTTSFPST